MPRKLGRTPDDVKVSVNLSPVEVGTLDLLRGTGWHTSRSDALRSALAAHLSQRRTWIERVMLSEHLVFDALYLDAAALQMVNQPLVVRVVGLVVIEDDVSPELAARAIGRIVVFGIVRIPPVVRARIDERVYVNVRGA